MGQIRVERDFCGIFGLCLITPAVHGDARGYFMETWSARDMAEAGLEYGFVQDCESRSGKGVLRGMHFQKRHPQAKLVRALYGAVFDAAVDLRAGSETFGRWAGAVLTAENRMQLMVPRGFAHGYLVLSDEAVFSYKCDDFYHPEDESGLAWDDPAVGIEWPGLVRAPEGDTVDGAPLRLADRDRCWPGLAETVRFSI